MEFYEYTDITGDGSVVALGLGGKVDGQPFIRLDSYHERDDGATQVFLNLKDAEMLAHNILVGIKEAREEN